jgi:hypothetical protein
MKNIPRMFATQTCLIVARCPVKSEATKDNPKAIIKHNNYLYILARDMPDKALALLQSDKKEEIEKLANEFLILPKGVDEKDADKKKTIVTDLVQEVEWVKEYCSTLPEDVNLSEMMKAYPDRETCYELMAKLDAESEIEAKANTNMDPMKMLLIVAGIIGLAVLMEIITIALLVQ